jgi:alpha-mannosidase
VTPTVLENEFYRVDADAEDGTLAILDKTTGARFIGANRFTDGGDRGDLYNFRAPENDRLIAQPIAPPEIKLESRATQSALVVRMTYVLPRALAPERTARADETVVMPITTTVTLTPGVPRVDFCTEVDNRARDHRLRVEFPTTIVTDTAYAEQAFDVIARNLNAPTDTADWIEQPRPEAPMQSFVSLTDGERGVTVASRGLPEYEVRRGENGATIALTLLRCIGDLSRDDFVGRVGHAGPVRETPGAQMIGQHVFEYAFIAHAGDYLNAFASAHAFAVPLRAVATDTHAGSLPRAASFVQASPREFVITAIKSAEEGEGLIVRGFNISNEPIQVAVRVLREFTTPIHFNLGLFTRAARVNLNEEFIAPLELREGRAVRFEARGKEIVTVRFEG